MDTPFRVALKVIYKLKERDTSVPLFRLAKLDFGDQCIKDDLEVNQCSFQGICHRDKIYTETASGHCECQDGFYGEDCRETNWCLHDHNVRSFFLFCLNFEYSFSNPPPPPIQLVGLKNSSIDKNLLSIRGLM